MKKGTSVVLWCLVLLITGSLALMAQEPGDVNNDGKVNIVDALIISKYYVNLNESKLDMITADVNGDKSISILDSLQIAKDVIGLNELPVSRHNRRISGKNKKMVDKNLTIVEKPAEDSTKLWVTHISGYQCMRPIFPTLKSAISFLKGKGIKVYKTKTTESITCQACRRCSNGTTFFALINSSDLELAQKNNWKFRNMSTKPLNIVTVSISSGRQCSETLPTEESAKMNLVNNNIKVFKIEKKYYITCQACGICPSGLTYFAHISNSDVKRAEKLGWKKESINSNF